MVKLTPAWTVQVLEGLLEFLHTELCSIFRGHLGGGAWLSPEEEVALRRLKDIHCNQDFDPESAEVWRRLREIWHVAFPGEAAEIADSDVRWKRLGFQSNNPCSDIRAGIFALDQLHYLACRYPALMQRLVTEASDLQYPYACACFNVSQVIVLFFNLLRRPAMNPVPGAVQASSIHLKNFACLCNSCPNGDAVVLHELFCALVERLHKTWKAMRAVENCTVMDFTRALKEVYVANAAFWQSHHIDIAEIRELSDHSRSQVGPSRSLGGVVKSRCKHMCQALEFHMVRTKNAVGKVLHPQCTSSRIASNDMKEKLLDMHERTYQPPDAPETAASRPALSAFCCPRARPVDGFDVDAFFENLGLDNKPEKLTTLPPEQSSRVADAHDEEDEATTTTSTRAPTPTAAVWDQIIAMELTLEEDKARKAPRPEVWDQIVGMEVSREAKPTTDATDLNAFLPCWGHGPQKVSMAAHVDLLTPKSNFTEKDVLWQDFGDW